MDKFPKEKISIVLQGGCVTDTKEVILSLQKLFPEAELILSTWENSDVSNLPTDKVIFSTDPGAIYCDKISGTLNNVNRQLVSTKAGIAAATRPFILKTRTDILFRDTKFLEYWGKYDDLPSLFLGNRLLICNYYTRNPRIFNTCFHPSDWIMFGRAEDIRAYYNGISLMSDEDGIWFRNHPKASTFFTNYLCRYTPEQHIFLSFLRQKQCVNCSCYYDHTPGLIEGTERVFAECFVVLDYQKQLGITFPKYDPNRYFEKHTLISHWQWKALYMHYCRKQQSILWYLYLSRSYLFCFLGRLRTICVLILDRLNLKETVKKILSTKQKKQH